jgi:hypothetical protein
LDEKAEISLCLYDLGGNIYANELNKEMIKSGNYQYSIHVPLAGTYLMCYYKNGNVNVKKIIVK